MTGLIERSLSAAAMIGMLILLRRLFLHRLPKFAFRAAWAVVVLRLLLPFSVPVFSGDVPGGIFLAVRFLQGEVQERNAGKTQADAVDGKGAEDDNMGQNGGSHPDGDMLGSSRGQGLESALNPGSYGDTHENMPPYSEGNESRENGMDVFRDQRKPDEQGEQMDGWQADGEEASGLLTEAQNAVSLERLKVFSVVLRNIWLAGALSFSLAFVISHLRARSRYAAALPVEYPLPKIAFYTWEGSGHKPEKRLGRRIAVKASDQIFAPVTYGILRPVILLPKTADWTNTAQLRMVLEHEAVHIRRFDILYKWLLAAAAALHWFNPFVWAMYFLANRDIELSCDEAVLRRLEKDGRKDYALALLSYEEKRMFSPTVSGFGGNAVKERIEAIMKINKTSMVGMAMAVILVAGTTTVFAGAKEGKNAVENAQKQTEGNRKIEDPDEQNPLEANQKNDSQDERNPDKEESSDKKENESQDGSVSVKQYRCEPAYYTPEEFEEFMEVECGAIQEQAEAGLITQEDADAMLAGLEKKLEEVRNGGQVEKPSQVYYADGTPVVNSQGGFLYVKASDIDRMNAELRAKAEGKDKAESVSEDVVATEDEGEGTVIAGSIWEDLPDYFVVPDEMDFSWYSYEEYKEYIEQQKEEYRQMKGEWGFNASDGWYEWDEEKIEEACRLLDENLDFIKNGGMISKPDMDGGTLMGGLMLSSLDSLMKTDEKENWSMSREDAVMKGRKPGESEEASQEGGTFDGEFLKAYEAFGVTADTKNQVYLYQGRTVMGLQDGGLIHQVYLYLGRKVAGLRDGGLILLDSAAKKENGIYLRGVRENGELVGVEEITEEEFNERIGRRAE